MSRWSRSRVARWITTAAWVWCFGATALTVHAEPPATHEIIYNRPSGFWTSNRPAEGGAYRYRLLLIGVALVLTTGWLTWRLLRRASAQPRRVAGPPTGS